MKRLASFVSKRIVVIGSIFCLSSQALAGEWTEQHLEMAKTMNRYYDEEKAQLPIGLAATSVALAIGGVMVSRDNQFAKGLGWPLLASGAFVGLGAGGYWFAVDSRKARASDLLRSSPDGYRARELEYLQSTQRNFGKYIGLDVALAAMGAGLAVYGVSHKNDQLAGAGLGSSAMFLGLMAIEFSNRARLLRYTNAVETFRPELGVSVDPVKQSTSIAFKLAF